MRNWKNNVSWVGKVDWELPAYGDDYSTQVIDI